ncbi:prepilin peptidase [Bacillus sp. AFS041924]|uniref:A24 family peptidase n=1 Tax=Bacillus sp. AFS041924 TaxID=2033503 RepID=UPI000BFE06E1|nr:prepilin peptidase [Bacillus sp. AFS041924]PGS51941.1 prepilin peptidase [Bacillus sp. AFS041924]
MFIITILGLILLISLITDIRNRKILNIVTFPAILIGFVYYTVSLGWEGLLFSGKGFLVGASFLFIPYLLGGMGAGDVKLMAAIGALTGTMFTFYSFIYTALIGGMISLVLIMKKRGIMNSIKSFFVTMVYFRSNLGSLVFHADKQSSIAFPYGVAIVLGTLCEAIFGVIK